MKKKTKKQYSTEYKASCVERALKIGNVASCARDLDLSYPTLTSWINISKSNLGQSSSTVVQRLNESKELQHLKRANARLREENSILKKATAYFSQKELKKGTRL
jgi:transposase